MFESLRLESRYIVVNNTVQSRILSMEHLPPPPSLIPYLLDSQKQPKETKRYKETGTTTSKSSEAVKKNTQNIFF